MAIRPPARRRGSARRRDRRLPDEAIGLLAGALISAMLLRVLLRSAGVEPWTATWRVTNVLTAPVIWPMEQLGFRGPTLIGTLTLSDLVAALLVSGLGLYLLASRAVIVNRTT